MKANTPEYLVQLRKATQDLHRSAEIASDSERLLGDSPSQSHYQQFLTTHYLFHRHVAAVSSSLCAQGQDAGLLDWPNCSRINALRTDLQQLKVTIGDNLYSSMHKQTHGFTLGLLYVAEGSCIGNQKVLASLNRSENFRQWDCSMFLTTCKDGFSDRWKSLLSTMHRLSTCRSIIDGSGYEDIEKGAIDGFKLYMKYWNLTGK